MKKENFRSAVGERLAHFKFSENRSAESATGVEAVQVNANAIHKNYFRKLVALLVSLAVLCTSVLIGIHVLASNTEQAQKRYVNELVTSKTVTPTGNRGEYNVRLEAYTTSEQIEYPATDIVLVLDLSGSMTTELRKSEYQNLYTHTILKEYPLNENVTKPGFDILPSKITYHDMYDSGNSNNSGSMAGIGTVSSNFGNNKYIEDPNCPGNYVYLACRYTYEFDHNTFGVPVYHQNYQFFFTDSYGNQYVSTKYHALAAWNDNIEYLEFSLAENGRVSPENVDIQTETFKIRSIFARVEDNYFTNSLNSTLASKDNLYIYDDNNVPCPVALASDLSDDGKAGTYTYSFTDSDGNTHTSVQGNMEYGAGYGLYQGFKTYRYTTDSEGNRITDSDGKYVIEVVHAYDEDATDNYSVESKSLYTKLASESYSLTRLQAMKEAVEQFILDVHSNAHLRDIDQRIAIVTFNNGATTQVDLTDVRDEVAMNEIIDKLYRFSAGGATQIDLGMSNAYSILNTNSSGRNKVAIAFTDGVPTAWGGSTYNTSAASSAISYAQKIEALEDSSTTSSVYSIGLFTGADSDQMYGSMFYHSGIFNPSTVCTGEVGSSWGRSNIAGLTNSDMSDVDAAATNRFLNLLSSNYPTATTVGVTRYTGIAASGGVGYRITANYPKTGSDYYFGSQSSEELYEAFKKIASDVAVPENTLGINTHLYDTVTDSFKIAGNVDVYTEAVDSTGNTWTRTDDTLTLDQSDLANSIINVTGFNYSENYLTAPNGTNPARNYGKKVVVEFTIQTIDNFVGGNSVPTNGSDSGIYGSDWILVEDFVLPLKDIEIEYALEAEDQEIFLTGHADLYKMLDIPDTLDGKTNAFVNIEYTVKDSDGQTVFTYYIPAGTKGENGTLSLQEEAVANIYPVLSDNETYTVTCNVDPIYDGDVDTLPLADDATVYVYKPVVTVEDQYVSLAEGQQGVDLSVESIVWKAEGKDAEKTEGAPSTSYKVKNTTDTIAPATPTTAYVMTETKDFQVYDFTIERNSFDYTTSFLCYIKKGVTGDGKYVPVSNESNPSADVYEVMTDEEGNIIYATDEDGNETTTPIFIMETVSMQKTVTVADMNNDDATNGGFVTFINSSDPEDSETPRENGEFTVYINKTYKLHIVKQFTGPMATGEGVTFTVTGPNNFSETLTITDFQNLRGENTAETNIELSAGVNYLLTEGFVDESTNYNKYNASAQKLIGEASTALGDNEETVAPDFAFSVENSEIQEDGTVITIKVTNEDLTEIPVLTGRQDSNSRLALLASAIAVFIIGASLLIYWYRRKGNNGIE